MLIADALAMPSHWVYNIRLMPRLFPPKGEITGFVDPPKHLPNSILNLSNTGGGGRGSDRGNLVGDVILHGKRKYWKRGKDYHYHTTLVAGEPTLEAQLMLLLMRTWSGTEEDAGSGAGSAPLDAFRDAYVEFMTTPGSHNDTYAATAHRMFFKNVMAGKDPVDAPDDDRHNVAAIDALTLVTPVLLDGISRGMDAESSVAAGMDMLAVTRNVPYIEPYVAAYEDLLRMCMDGTKPSVAAETVAARKLFRNTVNLSAMAASHGPGNEPMAACYLDSAFKVLLYLLYQYGDDPDPSLALLRNANAGGENVARGACLGACLGAYHGFPAWPDSLVSGLVLPSGTDATLQSWALPRDL